MQSRPAVPDALKDVSACLDALITHQSSRGPATGAKRLPRFLPDGMEIQSVDELSAMMGLDAKMVALLALEEKELNMSLRIDAKRLLGAPASDRGGVCIYLQPGMASAEGITNQVETTMPPEELHVTLAYFGTVDQMSPENTFSRILAWAEVLAADNKPFFARLNGIARFNGEEQDAVVLTVDAPEIEDMRKQAMSIFGNHVNRFHGYTPHMTIGYLDTDSDLHVQRTPPIDDVFIEYVTVAYGSQYVRVQLSKPREKHIHTASAGNVASAEKSRPRSKNRYRGNKP